MKGVKAFMCKISGKHPQEGGNDLLHQNDIKQKQKAETISGPTLAEQYIVIADYKKADKWDLNLKAGMVLEVIEKSDSGELY
ncbi:Hypothetical predicted protein [Mytilus galloprovincialis]|uniref:SH3 domain-containing protein n=1 Tax=Mytilus galloprovincialis TaxID=29158 RepID=A0A8B6E273_MYTGA|nr:Hypothetical predicted protein [Mytilus galloprovincialis]